MCRKAFPYFILWLFLSSCLLLSYNISAQTNELATLSELKEKQKILLTRLELLNEKLSQELIHSDKNLAILKGQLMSLSLQLEKSNQDLVLLKGMLLKAEESLKNLESSFNDYKQSAEKEISSQKKQKYLVIVAAIVAIVFVGSVAH